MKHSILLVLSVLFMISVNAQKTERAAVKERQSLSIEEVASNRTNSMEKIIELDQLQKFEIKKAYVDLVTIQRDVHTIYRRSIERANKRLEKARLRMDKKMKKILTEEQFKEFKEYSEKRQERGRKRLINELKKENN